MEHGFLIEGHTIKFFNTKFRILSCKAKIKVESCSEIFEHTEERISVREHRREKTSQTEKNDDITSISSNDILTKLKIGLNIFIIEMISNCIVFDVMVNDEYITYRYCFENKKNYLSFFNSVENDFYLIAYKFDSIFLRIRKN